VGVVVGLELGLELALALALALGDSVAGGAVGGGGGGGWTTGGGRGAGCGAGGGGGGGTGVGACVGLVMTTAPGWTAVKFTDFWPAPEPLVAPNEYVCEPGGMARPTRYVTPPVKFVPDVDIPNVPTPVTLTVSDDGMQPALSA
jgi:hypothetical protein